MANVISITEDLSFQRALSDRNRVDAINFKSLYINYRPAMLAFVSRHLTDVQFMEDIVQNAFVKIWRNIDQFDSRKAGIYTWMISICKNEMVDFLRSKHSIRFVELELGIAADDRTRITDHLDVSRLVESLNTEDCNTINLLFLHGYTYEQVSLIKKIPSGSIKTRVRKIMKALRTQVL